VQISNQFAKVFFNMLDIFVLNLHNVAFFENFCKRHSLLGALGKASVAQI
jgi:Sec7-like guanine-nucleotide exchange factor